MGKLGLNFVAVEEMMRFCSAAAAAVATVATVAARTTGAGSRSVVGMGGALRTISSTAGPADGMVGRSTLEHILWTLDEMEREDAASATSSSQSAPRRGKAASFSPSYSPSASTQFGSASTPSYTTSSTPGSSSFDLASLRESPVASTYSVQLNSFSFHLVDRDMVHKPDVDADVDVDRPQDSLDHLLTRLQQQ